jgi:hypothetical protein
MPIAYAYRPKEGYSKMTDFPEGAIRTREEFEALIERAKKEGKAHFYITDKTSRIGPRWVSPESKIIPGDKDGPELTYFQAPDPGDKSWAKSWDGQHCFPIAWLCGSEGVHCFTNYWWAYAWKCRHKIRP